MVYFITQLFLLGDVQIGLVQNSNPPATAYYVNIRIVNKMSYSLQSPFG